MSFRWEEDLRTSFEFHGSPALWSSAWRDRGALAVRESTCSDGRADWVWAAVGDDWPNGVPREIGPCLMQTTCGRILGCLQATKPRTEAFLEQRLGVSRSTLRRMLAKMLELRLLDELAPGRFVLGPNFTVPDIEICSFEFKLENWRRALYQATRYRSFSHRVFVVMPPAAAAKAQTAAATFRALNVGLISHDADGSSRRILPSPKRRPVARHRFFGAIGLLLDHGVRCRPVP